MPRAGPRRINMYTRDFKRAAALDIHPVMLPQGRMDIGNRTLRARRRPHAPGRRARSSSSKCSIGNTRSWKRVTSACNYSPL
jgi:hypothetical protein